MSDNKCLRNPQYLREIKPGVMVDVYDVLMAFEVTNPALAHGLKKLLCPGQRGTKSWEEDMKEGLWLVQVAMELEKERRGRP